MGEGEPIVNSRPGIEPTTGLPVGELSKQTPRRKGWLSRLGTALSKLAQESGKRPNTPPPFGKAF